MTRVVRFNGKNIINALNGSMKKREYFIWSFNKVWTNPFRKKTEEKTEFSTQNRQIAMLEYSKLHRTEALRTYDAGTGILTIYSVPSQTQRTLDEVTENLTKSYIWSNFLRPQWSSTPAALHYVLLWWVGVRLFFCSKVRIKYLLNKKKHIKITLKLTLE